MGGLTKFSPDGGTPSPSPGKKPCCVISIKVIFPPNLILKIVYLQILVWGIKCEVCGSITLSLPSGLRVEGGEDGVYLTISHLSTSLANVFI